MSLVVLTILICFIALSRMIARVRRDYLPWYLDVNLWFMSPWVLCMTLYSLPIFFHREVMQIGHVVYLATCFGAFFIGAFCMSFSGDHAAIDRNLPTSQRVPTHRTMMLLALAGFLGLTAKIADQLIITGFSISERLSSIEAFEQARQLRNLAKAAQIRGPFASFEILTIASLVFLALFVLRCFEGKLLEKHFRLYGAIAIAFALLFGFNSLFIEAGRVDILILLLLATAVALLDKNRGVWKYFQSLPRGTRRLFIAGALVVFVTAVVVLSTVFLQSRIGRASPVSMLAVVHRASVTPEVWQYVQGSPFLETMMLQLSYLTAPIATLIYFLDLPSERFPGPFFGVANFPGVFDRILVTIDPRLYAIDWFAQADAPLSLYGYGSNVWATLIRDLALDVTLAGVPIALLFLGAAAGFMSRQAYCTGRTANVLIAACLYCVLGFSAFHTVFNKWLVLKMLEVACAWVLFTALSNMFRIARKPLRYRREV